MGALAPGSLVALLEDGLEVILIDCRPFADFNSAHILEAVNVIGSRLLKRRIQQERLQVEELLGGVARRKLESEPVVVVYDQSTVDPGALAPDSFLSVLLLRLQRCVSSVHLLAGGFSHFSLLFPALCETKSCPGSVPPGSNPPLPAPAPTTTGPTRILPHLYLGCQRDVLNKEVMDENLISFVLNVSRSCPQPDFIPSSRFLRVPINDSFSEKILPWLDQCMDFIEAAKTSNSRVLVHCLAGISRSATIAIAYIMKRRSLSLDEAYRFVKALRPSISPNFNFLGQLLDFEKMIKSSDNPREMGPPADPAPLEPLTLPCNLADTPEERRLHRALSGLKLTRNLEDPVETDPKDQDSENPAQLRHPFSLDIRSHSEVVGSSTQWSLDSTLRPGEPWQFSPVLEVSERCTPEQSPDKEEADAPVRAPPPKSIPCSHPDNSTRFLLGLSRSTQQLTSVDPTSALKGWNSDLLLSAATATWLRPHDSSRILSAMPLRSLEAVQRRGQRAESSRRASRSSWHEESSFEKTLKRRSCRTEDDLHSSGSMEVIQVS